MKLLNKLISAYEAIFDAVFVQSITPIIYLCAGLVLIGHLGACFHHPKKLSQDVPKVVEYAANNPTHSRLKHSLDVALAIAFLSDAEPKTIFVESKDINAASYGRGRFMLWEGLNVLPDSALDSILAHELAHDYLMHSIKARDWHDFTLFWTELIGFLGRADFESSETLNSWGSDLTIPIYSKEQEYAADLYALTILERLDYKDPKKQYAEMLRLLLKQYGNTGGGFFSSHPSTEERIARIMSAKKGIGSWEAGGIHQSKT